MVVRQRPVLTIVQDSTPPTANITAGDSTLTCTVTSITLTATGGESYVWSTSATTDAITVTTVGTYAVTVTGSNGCTATDSIIITQNTAQPSLSITSTDDSLTCTVNTIVLTAMGGASYSWSNGATTDTTTITTAGIYTVTVSGANGCTQIGNAIIVQDTTPPAVTITPSDDSLTCSVTSIVLTATGGGSYVWSDGSTTNTTTVTTAGTYTVTVTGTNGCTATNSITITQDATVPTATIAASDDSLTCDVTSILLTATGGDSYAWSNGASTDTTTVTTAGTYTVTATAANGCTDVASITITQSATVPVVSITASDDSLTCLVTSITLTATGDGSYAWSNGATTDTTTVTAAGTYTVTVTSDNGCTATASITIAQSSDVPTVTITASDDSLTCTVTSILLTATGGTSYAWSTGSTTDTTTVTTAGTYTVTVTNDNGCSATSSIIISEAISTPTAGITADDDSLTCSVTSIVLTATGGDSYAWSTGSTTDTTTVTAAGTYTVTVTGANGCTDTESISISEDTTTPTAAITSSEDSLTCSVTSITLTATGGDSYEWSNGSTTDTTTVTAAGTYTVTVTADNGCTDTESITITQSADVPVATITSSDDSLTCSVTSITLTATGGESYLWSNGSTTDTTTVTTAGTYTVTATGASGCTATDSITIIQDATVPTADITASDDSLTCEVTSITLTATGGGSYAWSNGSATDTTMVTTAGTYTVTVTADNGCTATDSITINQSSDVPTAAITSSDDSLTCSVTSITLTATGGGSYAWSNGSMADTTTVTTAGTYTVTVTADNGCTAIASITIAQSSDVPTAAITASDDSLTCEVTSITLTATGGGSYAWSDGSTTDTTTVTTAGTYTVTVTADNGCTAIASITIDQDDTVPTADIASSDDSLTCTVTSITLTATGGDSYAWSDGSTTDMTTVTTAGTYTVTVTSDNGCTDTASITISQSTDVPTASITSSDDSLTCEVTSITLTATGGDSYAWSNGSTTDTTTVTTAGTYTVTVTAANGCTDTASITIAQSTDVPTATITASDDSLTCTVTSITLTATGGDSYIWLTDETTDVITVATAGTYTVTVTAANGCTDTSSITINQDAAVPTATITPSGDNTTLTCDVTSITLTATGGDSYEWSSGETTDVITVTTAGTYTVTVTAANGCTDTSSITITEDAAVPTATITPSGDNTTLTCDVTTITLTATGGDSYEWSSGETTDAITVTTAGTYTVTVTAANGCTDTSSITISQDATVPTADITATGDELTCNVTSITLTATGGDTYVWSSGETTDVITVTTAGTYTVTVTAANGCTDTASITISEDTTAPTAGITASNPSLTCLVTSVTLTATGGGSYVWLTGETTDAIAVTTGGTYTVTVTGSNGCTATASRTISEDNAFPSLSADVTCEGEVGTITVNAQSTPAGHTLSYSLDGGTPQASNVFVGLSNGSYIITVVDTDNGCSTTLTDVLVECELICEATASNDGPVCVGSAAQLSANDGGTSYAWSGPAGTSNQQNPSIPSMTVAKAGVYTVTVTYDNGCTATATTLVSVNKRPKIPTINTSCSAGAGTITVTAQSQPAANGVEYSINGTTFQSSNVFTGVSNGTYTITVRDLVTGCTNTKTVTVTCPACPTVTATNSGPVCEGASVQLGATASGMTGGTSASVTWTGPNGFTATGVNVTVPVATAGVYTVNVTFTGGGLTGCTATASTTVVVQACCQAEAGNLAVSDINCADQPIAATASGQNTAAGYGFYFLLTDMDGDIVEVNTDGDFGVQPTGDYQVYGYSVSTSPTVGGPNPPTVGTSVADISGTCYALSDPATITVPTSVSVLTSGTVTEGTEGGVSPFEYNTYTVEITGGVLPYAFDWLITGYVRHEFEPNAAGTGGVLTIVYTDESTWSVTVSDNDECLDQTLVYSNNTNGNPLLDIDSYEVSQTSDAGQSDGSITLMASGGDTDCGQYGYEWSGPATWSGTAAATGSAGSDYTLTGLPSGWYSVTVTDCVGETTTGWFWLSDGQRGRTKVTCLNNLSVYPNPFATEAYISFSTTATTHVQVNVYGLDGKEVATLFNGTAQANQAYQLTLDGSQLPVGSYFIKVVTDGGETQTQQVIISR